MPIKTINNPKFQAFDSTGAPLNGGKLYTYKAGTSTEKVTYSDIELSTANANPVVLDSRGEATIYGQGAFKFVLKTSADVTVWTVDNITAESGGDIARVEIGDYSDDLTTAISTIGATETSLVINKQVTLTASDTVPDNITLEFTRGGSFTAGSAYTLTVNGPIVVGEWQIIDSSNITLAGSPDIPFVIPQWWGADTAAFQAALTFAVTNGYELFLPPGSYTLTSGMTTIDGCQGLTIRGCGPEVSSIVFGGDLNMFTFTGDAQFSRNITFKDFSITNPSRTYSGNAFDLEKCSKFTFENIEFRDTKGKVITATSFWDSSFVGCKFQDTGDTSDPTVYLANLTAGTPSTGCNNIRFVNCNWDGFQTTYAVHLLQDAKKNNFINCKFHGDLPTPDDTHTIYMDGDGRDTGCFQNSFVNCNFANAGQSHVFITGGAQGNKFIGCHFGSPNAPDAATTAGGIHIDSTAADALGTVIIGNTFNGNSKTGSFGVKLDGATDSVVVGNYFYAHDKADIWDTATAVNTTCHSNVYKSTVPFFGTTYNEQLELISTYNGIARMLTLKSDPSTAAANDGAGIQYNAKDDADNEFVRAAEIRFLTTDVTDGSEDTDIKFAVTSGGTNDTVIATCDGSAKTFKVQDSAWDGVHLELGSYHIWIDSTGDLRIKSSAPANDTDGTIVGTQS